MSDLSVDEVIHAWTAQHDKVLSKLPPEAVALNRLLTDSYLKELAEGRPVSAAMLAERTGLPTEQMEQIYAQFKEKGGEFDENGNLVGAALTLNPTRHKLRLNDRLLYTWCALDALFIPGLIGESAQVESTCPVTGEAIRMRVSSEGVKDVTPAGTVLTIAVPGVSCAREENRKTGPNSESCTQMHFFASRQAPEEWIKDYPGVAIFTVEEAWRLAYTNWIARRQEE